MIISRTGGSVRRHRNGTTETIPVKYSIMEQGNERIILATFSNLADAALISRYLDNGYLPDAECIRAQQILKNMDNTND